MNVFRHVTHLLAPAAAPVVPLQRGGRWEPFIAKERQHTVVRLHCTTAYFLRLLVRLQNKKGKEGEVAEVAIAHC